MITAWSAAFISDTEWMIFKGLSELNALNKLASDFTRYFHLLDLTWIPDDWHCDALHVVALSRIYLLCFPWLKDTIHSPTARALNGRKTFIFEFISYQHIECKGYRMISRVTPLPGDEVIVRYAILIEQGLKWDKISFERELSGSKSVNIFLPIFIDHRFHKNFAH